MKFIDLDNAGLRSAIEKTVQLGQSGTGDCLKHSDCNYFDCKGICNLVTGDSQQSFNKIPQSIWNSFGSVFHTLPDGVVCKFDRLLFVFQAAARVRLPTTTYKFYVRRFSCQDQSRPFWLQQKLRQGLPLDFWHPNTLTKGSGEILNWYAHSLQSTSTAYFFR